MSRDTATLETLKEAMQKGIAVINSPEAVERCSRITFMDTLLKSGIPQPPFAIIEKAENLDTLPYPAWIKKAEGWSCHKDDVAYAKDKDEARNIFGQMQKRGIAKAIHSTHMDGDLIKFYAIGHDWFHYCYPEHEKTKFGLETFNGTPKHYPFNSERLKEIAGKAGKAIGLEIYGGDCIIDNNGHIYIIDINDFPSFSAVRREAARKIAKLIVASIQKKKEDEKR
jgi:glutathione synthase/RimK-type ligase-like ATP-grasp enzyme